MKRNGFGAVIAGVTLFVMLFIFSQDFISGISRGLITSVNIIVPSLLPFIIAAALTGSGRLPGPIRRFARPVCRFLFALPEDTALCILTSQLGGYIAGAKGAQSLYSNGIVSSSQARRLLYFSINAGPGFCVNAVGNGMLCSRQAGRVLFASLCISSLITGFAVRFLPSESRNSVYNAKNEMPFSAIFTKSVSSGVQAVLSACGFTAFASGIISVISAHIGNDALCTALSCIIEVTNGCASLSGKASLPVIAAVCAFGGLCVHLQVFSLFDKIGLSLPLFYAFRLLHSTLAFAVCKVITHFIPVESEVFLSFSQNAAAFSFSAPAAISLLFLFVLIILDLDNGVKI